MTDWAVRPGIKVSPASHPSSSGTVGAFLRVDSDPSGYYFLTCAHVVSPAGAPLARRGERLLIGNSQVDAAEVVGCGNWEDGGPDVAVAKADASAAGANPLSDVLGPVTGITWFKGEGLRVYAKGADDPKPRTGKIIRENNGEIEVRSTPDGDFGNAGDSGAVVVNRFGRALGMIIARETKLRKRYVMPIQTVLAEAVRVSGFGGEEVRLLTTAERVDLVRSLQA